MRLGLIGTRGHIGMLYPALAALPQLQVTVYARGGVDDDPGHILAALEQHGSRPRMVDDWQEVVDDPAIDALVVSGPYEAHGTICLRAINRGLPVLCEKPVAADLATLAALEAAWQARPVLLTTMMSLRGQGPFRAAQAAVAEGRIGPLRLIQAQKSYKLKRRPPWFCSRQGSTGIFPWVGSHAFDLIRWCSGAEVLDLAAWHDIGDNRDHGDLEMTAACACRLEGGILATVTCDYLRPQAAASHEDDRLRLVGMDGIIEVRQHQALIQGGDGDQALVVQPDVDLVAAFCQGRPLVPTEDVFAVTRTCLLAREQADDRS